MSARAANVPRRVMARRYFDSALCAHLISALYIVSILTSPLAKRKCRV